MAMNAMPRNMPDQPRADDVAGLPELAAEAPAGRLERRDPDQDRDHEEGLVLEGVHERVVERRLERGREVPAVEDDARRWRWRRAAS